MDSLRRESAAIKLPRQPPLAPPIPASPGGGGSGLRGEYYNGVNFDVLALTRIDPTIDFAWLNGSPGAGVDVDNFTARWTGQVQPLYSETYTFYTTSDDGVRLRVNGQLVINNWTDHGPTEDSGTITLVANQRYDQELFRRPAPKVTTKPATKPATGTASTQPVIDTQLKAGTDSLRSLIIFQGSRGDFVATAPATTRPSTRPATQP